MRSASTDEQAWLQTVIGALAADLPTDPPPTPDA
jgi:hypothetical protein